MIFVPFGTITCVISLPFKPTMGLERGSTISLQALSWGSINNDHHALVIYIRPSRRKVYRRISGLNWVICWMTTWMRVEYTQSESFAAHCIQVWQRNKLVICQLSILLSFTYFAAKSGLDVRIDGQQVKSSRHCRRGSLHSCNHEGPINRWSISDITCWKCPRRTKPWLMSDSKIRSLQQSIPVHKLPHRSCGQLRLP